MKSKFFLIILLFLTINGLNAKIKVASLLTDNMVLQRNSEVKIWGKADPNQKLTIKASWNNQKVSALANEKGEWLAKIKTTEAGGPYIISIASCKEKVQLQNVLLGEVWLCSGQSNMEMMITGMSDSPINGSTDVLINANTSTIRLYTVAKASMPQPQDTCKGSWMLANPETVSRFSAVGYFFAKMLTQHLNVPIGVICTSWGGSRIESWMKNDVITGFDNAYKQTTSKETPQHHRASQLYNGMIAPLVNYNIKGALWYQGESNIGNYADYAALQAAMVKNWRADFGVGDFPFYYVEIAPYWYNNSMAINAALQREAQYKAMLITPNSGMISTIDIGEEMNIHPAEKQTVGKRLALYAISGTYGAKSIPYKSPTFKEMVLKDSVAILSFENLVQGLTTFGKAVDCFEIAGQDSVFYPAKIKISKRQVHVSSSNVKSPVAVRYAFRNCHKSTGYLYNTAGIPVLPFRTDKWQK